jgi:hypothetical protein
MYSNSGIAQFSSPNLNGPNPLDLLVSTNVESAFGPAVDN